jgi:WXG100 family type VII secretion target
MTTDPGSIYVNYGQIDNVLEELEFADQNIQNILNDLNEQIQPLRATWSGASDDEYQAVQNKWNADLANMSAVLSKYGGVLSEITLNYGQTDNNLAAQWAALT